MVVGLLLPLDLRGSQRVRVTGQGRAVVGRDLGGRLRFREMFSRFSRPTAQSPDVTVVLLLHKA